MGCFGNCACTVRVCTLIGGYSSTACMLWRLYLAVVISQFLGVAALVTSLHHSIPVNCQQLTPVSPYLRVLISPHHICQK